MQNKTLKNIYFMTSRGLHNYKKFINYSMLLLIQNTPTTSLLTFQCVLGFLEKLIFIGIILDTFGSNYILVTTHHS